MCVCGFTMTLAVWGFPYRYGFRKKERGGRESAKAIEFVQILAGYITAWLYKMSALHWLKILGKKKLFLNKNSVE